MPTRHASGRGIALRALESVADSVAGVPARRKTLIFFSEGAAIASLNQEFLDLQGRVLAAAARANATIYALDPKGLDQAVSGETRGLEQPPGSLDPHAAAAVARHEQTR